MVDKHRCHMVALIAGIPFICPISPGVGDSNWSTDMHCPGAVMILVFVVMLDDGLFLHGPFVALPNKQDAHCGILHVIKALGK